MNRRRLLDLLVRLLAEREAEDRRQAERDDRDDADDVPTPTHGDTSCTLQ